MTSFFRAVCLAGPVARVKAWAFIVLSVASAIAPDLLQAKEENCLSVTAAHANRVRDVVASRGWQVRSSTSTSGCQPSYRVLVLSSSVSFGDGYRGHFASVAFSKEGEKATPGMHLARGPSEDYVLTTVINNWVDSLPRVRR